MGVSANTHVGLSALVEMYGLSGGRHQICLPPGDICLPPGDQAIASSKRISDYRMGSEKAFFRASVSGIHDETLATLKTPR